MISMTCPCGGEYWIRDRLAGQSVNCPGCRRTLAVPPMSVIEETMTSTRCPCGEVFWSSSWRPGRLSKCPACGKAVGLPTTSSGTTTLLDAERGTDKSAKPGPRDPRPGGLSPRPTTGSRPDGRLGKLWASGRRGWAAAPWPKRAAALAASIVLAAGAYAAYRTFTPPGPGVVQALPSGPGVVQAPPPGPGVVETPSPEPPAPDKIIAGRPASRARIPFVGRHESAKLALLVPAYIYPGGPGREDWDRLIEAAARVPIVAVVNPESGPGMAANPDYVDIVDRASQSGVAIIGYVNTGHGRRPLPEIEADIDRWVQFYPDIKGVFFDAQSSRAEDVDLYASLRGAVLRKLPGAIVVGNPGTICSEEYLSRPAVDIAVLFENPEGFETFQLPAWSGRHNDREFAVIPYRVETPDGMRAAVNRAVDKRIGCVFITDGALPNPWGRLPSYWLEEVDAVQQVNEGKSL